MYIAYKDHKFSRSSQEIIDTANEILDKFASDGFSMTLRQLYYQFVSKDFFRNNMQSYNRLKGIMTNARLAGEVSWTALEDRTRSRSAPYFIKGGPAELFQDLELAYKADRWEGQDCRVEVWIEKDALIGMIDRTCRELEITSFACKGYVSASEMWRAGQRFRGYLEQGITPIVLHFGDHDPSGIQMTSDNRDRLAMFAESWHGVDVRRLALNMDQVEEHSPPPNPAKQTDSRYADYAADFGDESWELDALTAVDPHLLSNIIRQEVEPLINRKAYNKVLDREDKARSWIKDVVSAGQDDIGEFTS